MNSAVDGQTPSRRLSRYALEHDLAPNVDEAWAESFLVELRLLGIEGTRIGAALSEVESHCAESGQSAQQAFGDPAEYARSLGLPELQSSSTRAILHSVATVLVQVMGMFILSWSFDGWLRGSGFDITIGQVLGMSLFLLSTVALARFLDPLFRLLVHHPIRSVLLTYVVGAGLFVVPVVLLDDVIWHGSAGWGCAAGIAVLAGGVIWAIMRLPAYRSEQDPILSPFQTKGTSSTRDASRSRRRSFDPFLLIIFTYTAMIPAGTVILLAMTWMIHNVGA